jgi:hypothetical protein
MWAAPRNFETVLPWIGRLLWLICVHLKLFSASQMHYFCYFRRDNLVCCRGWQQGLLFFCHSLFPLFGQACSHVKHQGKL